MEAGVVHHSTEKYRGWVSKIKLKGDKNKMGPKKSTSR